MIQTPHLKYDSIKFTRPITVNAVRTGDNYRIDVLVSRATVHEDAVNGPTSLTWRLSGNAQSLEIDFLGSHAFQSPPQNGTLAGGVGDSLQTGEVDPSSAVRTYHYLVRVEFDDGVTVEVDPEYDRER